MYYLPYLQIIFTWNQTVSFAQSAINIFSNIRTQIETAKGAETFLDFLMVAEQTFDDGAAGPAAYVYKDDDDI